MNFGAEVAAAAVGLVVQAGLQDSLVVLATVEHADDRYKLGGRVEGDHGPPFVVCVRRPGRMSSRRVPRCGKVRNPSQYVTMALV